MSLLLAVSSIGRVGDQQTAGETVAGKILGKVNLADHGGKPAGMEFSSDGRHVLSWWFPQPPVGDTDKILGKCVVFDLTGAVVSSATDASGHLAPEYVMQFPTTASRQHFAWFLADTNNASVCLWGFSPDYSLGLRYLKPEGYALPGNAELWRMSPSAERRCQVRLPEEIGAKGLAGFFGAAGHERLLIAFFGINAYVLSAGDGALLESFHYDPLPPSVKVQPRNKSADAQPKQADNVPKFFAGELAFDSQRGLLACGANEGKHIRVLSAESPHRVVFEAHVGESPTWPWGGLWTVASLDFCGGGRFLVAGYQYGGRATRARRSRVEIVDTTLWQIVWSTDDVAVSPVVPPQVSVAGNTLALIKGHWLEITAFRK